MGGYLQALDAAALGTGVHGDLRAPLAVKVHAAGSDGGGSDDGMLAGRALIGKEQQE